MSLNLISCSVVQIPCPQENQDLIAFSEVVTQAISAIDPAELLTAYAFGAGSVVTWWGLGFVIAVATKAIGKA